MIAEQQVERFEDLEDGPESLGRKDDGKIPQYSWKDGRFVMIPMPEEGKGGGVAIASFNPGGSGGTSTIAGADDFTDTTGPGTDGYSIVWDNATNKFILSEITGGASTITGATDFTDTTGPGTDGYSVVWDDATSKFILSEITGGGGGTPGGSDTQVQYNDGGAFGGDAGLTWDTTNELLVVSTDKGTAGVPWQSYELARFYRAGGSSRGLMLGYGTRGFSDPGVDAYGVVKGINGAFLALSSVSGGDFGVPEILIHSGGMQLGKDNRENNNNTSDIEFTSPTVWKTSLALGNTNSASIYASNAISSGSVGDLILQTRLLIGQDKHIAFYTGDTVTDSIKMQIGTVSGAVIKNYDSSSIVPMTIESITTSTATVDDMMQLSVNPISSGGIGLGTAILFSAKSSTTNNQLQGRISWSWTSSTDATRASRADFTTFYTSTERTSISIGSNSSAPLLGFYGTAPAAKPDITGSRGGNAALADLLTKLATIGLITDSTT